VVLIQDKLIGFSDKTEGLLGVRLVVVTYFEILANLGGTFKKLQLSFDLRTTSLSQSLIYCRAYDILLTCNTFFRSDD
jgi:hypothetical protein